MAEEFNNEDAGEKTEEPTQHRIDEFRKRGEVASSRELTSIFILSASVFVLFFSTVYIYETMVDFFKWVYGLNVSKAFLEESLKIIFSKMIWVAVKCLIPIFATVILSTVVINIVQIGFLFAPEVLSWKFERINPVNGMKKLFSMQSLVETVKGVFKFIFVIAITWFFIRENINSYQGFYHIEFLQTFLIGQRIILKLVASILGALLIIAVGDLAYQKIKYKKKLRMTKEQAKREHKEHDGNPEIKQRIRTIQREMSKKRMMNEIKTADVVVTNPTHFSVALKYDGSKMISPQVVAKGADHMAMKIREIAKNHDVPMVENVPLARALYDTVKLNGFVPRTLYAAVAEVISFVYKLKKKKKALG